MSEGRGWLRELLRRGAEQTEPEDARSLGTERYASSRVRVYVEAAGEVE
jgi:hypothetical protein